MISNKEWQQIKSRHDLEMCKEMYARGYEDGILDAIKKIRSGDKTETDT